MAKIRFDNGVVVNFNGTPTAADIEEIASRFGASKKEPPNLNKAIAELGSAQEAAMPQNVLKEAALGTVKDVANIPGHFINQYLMNAPRSAINTMSPGLGNEVFKTTSPVAGALAGTAGVAGAVMSPLNKFLLFKASTLPKIAGAGALAGAAYSPTENIGDIGQRSLQAAGGAIGSTILGGVSRLIKNPPVKMNDSWMLGVAEKTKDSVDKAIGALRTQYEGLLTPNFDKPFTGLKSIPKGARENFGLTDKSSLRDVWQAYNDVNTDIADRVWEIPGKYKKFTPSQKDMLELRAKLKASLLNDLDKETRNAVLDLDPKFAEAITKGRAIRADVFNEKTGEYKFENLKNIFATKEKAGQRKTYKDFEKFSKTISDTERDIKKYIARQELKKLAPWTAGGAAALSAIYGLSKKGR